MRVRFRGPRLTRLTTKKGAASTAPGFTQMFTYPPNSRAQNPFDRSASSSRRSSSALSRSASARARSSSALARSRSRSSRAVDSACAVSSKRPSRCPSSLWRSCSPAPPGACPGPSPVLLAALVGSWRPSPPASPWPRPSWRPGRRGRSRRRPPGLRRVPALVLALEVSGP